MAEIMILLLILFFLLMVALTAHQLYGRVMFQEPVKWTLLIFLWAIWILYAGLIVTLETSQSVKIEVAGKGVPNA